MEKRADGYYQAGYAKGVEKIAKRFDITVGPATIGQSYLYWQNQNLFQLPISYFAAADQWSNSPGFPNDVVFDRPITARCMECHTTFMETSPKGSLEPHDFDRNKMILSIDCERCHGPAKQHVEFQTNNPQIKEAKYIVNTEKLEQAAKPGYVCPLPRWQAKKNNAFLLLLMRAITWQIILL